MGSGRSSRSWSSSLRSLSCLDRSLAGLAVREERPIRIVIIAPPWVAVPPTAYGGTEAVLDTLARGLHGAGHDVVLFTTGDSTCPVPRESILPRAIGVGIGGSATELRHVIHAYEAAAGADLVHDHTL